MRRCDGTWEQPSFFRVKKKKHGISNQFLEIPWLFTQVVLGQAPIMVYRHAMSCPSSNDHKILGANPASSTKMFIPKNQLRRDVT